MKYNHSINQIQSINPSNPVNQSFNQSYWKLSPEAWPLAHKVKVKLRGAIPTQLTEQSIKE
jgi:hypothetical protein